MKYTLLLSVLILGIIACACAPTLRFDQTCITCFRSQNMPGQSHTVPKTFLSGQDCMVTMVETGENLSLNKILTEEKMVPQANIPVTIAKVNGKIYLTGNGFSNLWIITPKAGNTASFKSIGFPKENLKIDEPVFTLDYERFRLKLSANNLDGITYILDDDSEWIPEKSGKAGE